MCLQFTFIIIVNQLLATHREIHVMVNEEIYVIDIITFDNYFQLKLSLLNMWSQKKDSKSTNGYMFALGGTHVSLKSLNGHVFLDPW